jgi:hypothetical protein
MNTDNDLQFVVNDPQEKQEWGAMSDGCTVGWRPHVGTQIVCYCGARQFEVRQAWGYYETWVRCVACGLSDTVHTG